MNHDLSSLPSIDHLLRAGETDQLLKKFGRTMAVEAFRSVLTDFRSNYQNGQDIPFALIFIEKAENLLEGWFEPTLKPVINATGVVLHTNLGRAPLSQRSIEAVQNAMGSYTSLEFNLSTGKRGSRLIHAEDILKRLTGAEAGLVVNNNASAVLLALTALARRRRVVISRTQLVEIGGGFRIPDVMKQSGAKLVEIGTTNRVHLSDYELALEDPAALVMRAHQSNFRIIGFTSEPNLPDIVEVAHRNNVAVMDDLGSGSFIDTAKYGLKHEPTIQESISSGVDLVSFSGDKLLGGPQAGILLGKKRLIDRIKKHPLARAVRADKICLAALSATLMHYIREEADREIPIWQMIAAPASAIKIRAQQWRDHLQMGKVQKSKSTVGGGSLPEETLETYVLSLTINKPDQFLLKIRKLTPPIIARIEEDEVVFDPRTVFVNDDGIFLESLSKILIPYKRTAQ